MTIFIIVLVFILLIIVLSKIIPEGDTKPMSKSERVIADLNKYRQNYSYRPSDELYASVVKQHNTKTLEQIDEYIKAHRKNNDPYWGRNRMEYKILMERQAFLLKSRDIIN